MGKETNKWYKNIEEFNKNKDDIRKWYKGITPKEIDIYKRYVYTREMKEYMKDMIWEFLNEDRDSEYYIIAKLGIMSSVGYEKRGKE